MRIIFILLIDAFLLLNCSNSKTSESNQVQSQSGDTILVLATGLEVPWGMDFLPDGRLIFNERPGRINILDLKSKEKKLLMTRDIHDRAEGGLLGLAVDPQFSKNHFIYIYETVDDGNRIVRLKFENDVLTEDKILVDSIPKKLFHDGGILRFGPDGYLYAGTGDARTPENAQDINSLSGKILRMDRDGNIPDDNPFHNYVWSYGHRNVQGLCWTENREMFATEHGPSGELNGWCCHDELNKIVKGGNYGWPFVIGDDTKENTIPPLIHSGEDTWAPGGIVYAGGNVFYFACLRGERLILFDYTAFGANAKEFEYKVDVANHIYGRIRNIIKAPDGSFIFCTSNRDGRGDPASDDDRIIQFGGRF